MLHVDDGDALAEGDGHHVLAARKDGHGVDAILEHLLLNGLLGLLTVQLRGEILADAVSVVFSVGFEADVEVDRALVPQVRQEDADEPGARLAQLLGLLVGDIAELLAGVKDTADLVAADVAAAVEHVGYRSLRHARNFCDVLDGCHALHVPLHPI